VSPIFEAAAHGRRGNCRNDRQGQILVSEGKGFGLHNMNYIGRSLTERSADAEGNQQPEVIRVIASRARLDSGSALPRRHWRRSDADN